MKKNYSVPFVNVFLFADLDVDNPACKDDPYVRIGYVDKVPTTQEEYVKFVAEHPVLGTLKKLLSIYSSDEDYINDNENNIDELKEAIIYMWATFATGDVMTFVAKYQINYYMNKKHTLTARDCFDLVRVLQYRLEL